MARLNGQLLTESTSIMSQLQPYVTVPASSQILGTTLNLSFQSLFSMLNNFNGSGVDYTNIGTAGLNASQFTTTGSPVNAQTGTFSVNNLTLPASGAFFASSPTALALAMSNVVYSSYAQVFVGRTAQNAAAVFLGGSGATAALSWNGYGANEFAFGAPVWVGYQGALVTQAAPSPPCMNANGAVAPCLMSYGVDKQYSAVLNAVNTSTSVGYQASPNYMIIMCSLNVYPGNSYPTTVASYMGAPNFNYAQQIGVIGSEAGHGAPSGHNFPAAHPYYNWFALGY